MNQLNFLKLLRKALVNISLAQLSFGPTIVYAQMSAQQVIDVSQQLGSSAIDLHGQYQQQRIMTAQMLQGARAVRPPLKPNDLVKQCNMPQKPDPMPTKCLDPVAQVAPQEAGAAMASACNAEKALNYLKGALPGGESSSMVSCPNPVTGFNSNVPTGLLPTSTYGANCMEDFRENLALQIQNGVLNDLKRLKSSMAEEVKLAKEANKQILSDIEDVNDELNGSDNPDGNGIKEFFAQDAACQLAMDAGAIPNLNQVGLNGAVKMFETPVGKDKRPLTSLAMDFRNNAEGIRGDLKKIITKMSETASSLGPDGFMKDLEQGGPALGLYVKEFDSIKKLIPQTVGSYKKERDRVAQKFTDMGMQMPNLDEDFDRNSEELLSNTSFFENCFIGREAGASIPFDQIQFKTAKGFSGGTIENKVKKSMQEILNNPDLDSQGKLSRIRDLDQEIRRDPKTGRPILEIRADINGTPTNFGLAQFYNNQATNCEKKFKTSDNARNLEEANKLVDSLKNIKSSFQTNLRNIVGQIENCNGASLRSNPNACSDGSAMSPSSPAFCLDTASRCEQSIQSCFQKAQGLRNQKVAQRKDMANLFNANMTGLQQRFDQQIVALNKSVSGVQKSLSGFLKVAEVIPEMDRMGTLSMEESPFGIDLLDAGSFDRFEKNIPQAIDALMEAMKKQGETINQKIVDNMQEESDRVKKLIAEFDEIKKSCESVFQTKRQQDAEKQKEQQELMKKAADACSNARNSFAPQTKPGCEQLKKVADDMYEVASVLTPNAMGFANGISNYCDQEQKADDPAGESAVGELSRICSAGGNPKSELTRLKDKVLGDQSYADLIREDPSFEGSPAGRTAKEIESALSIIEKKETSGTVSRSKKDKAKKKLKKTHQAVVDAIKGCDKDREDKIKTKFTEFNYPNSSKKASSLGYGSTRAAFHKELTSIDKCKTNAVDSSTLKPIDANYTFGTIEELMNKWQPNDSKKSNGSPCYTPGSGDGKGATECRQSVRDYLIAENTKCSQESLMKVSDIGQSNHTQKANEFDDKIAHCEGDKKTAAEDAIKEFKAAANNPDTFKKTPGDSGICQQMIADANAYGDEICTEDVVTESKAETTTTTSSTDPSEESGEGQTSSTEERTSPQPPKNVTPAKVKGCDPKEKAAERMNEPVDVDLKIIENAIKMGQNTQGLSGSNPYLNKIGEHLNGACHMGEIPNPSDILNPNGIQSTDEEKIYGSNIRAR